MFCHFRRDFDTLIYNKTGLDLQMSPALFSLPYPGQSCHSEARHSSSSEKEFHIAGHEAV